MPHATLIAQKLAEVLTATEHPAHAIGATLFLDQWNVRVHVMEGSEKQQAGRAMIMPTILMWHRYFRRGFARELGVGLGENLEQAVQHVCASWTMLFFPLTKFLFDEHPHDCFVHEEPIALTRASRPYRLLAGPAQMMGFRDGVQPANFSQSAFWNAFSDLLLPRVGFGVHHLRCYVNRNPQGVSADVFLDAEEVPEASARLKEMAQSFPTPDDANPIYSLKQQLLLVPENLETGAAQATAEQVRIWSETLADKLSNEDACECPHVLLALRVMSQPSTESEQEQEMVANGAPANVAGALISFLPSAAARVLLQEKIQFAQQYYWCNSTTRRAVRQRYDQAPLFLACLSVLKRLQDANVAGFEIFNVAGTSAEMNAVNQAVHKGVKIESIRFTSIIHSTNEPIEGENIDELLARDKAAAKQPAPPAPEPPEEPKPRRPWWKVW